MFGIEKIQKKFKAIDIVLEALCGNSKDNHNHIKSVQSTNDKRYNELNQRITKVRDYLGEEDISYHNKLADEISHRVIETNLVTCDTCHCLLYKKDAIKGESRIVGDCVWTSATYDLMTGEVSGKPSHQVNEKIQEVYYCHRCRPEQDFELKVKVGSMKGKNAKTGNKKTRSTVVKTNKK